LLFITLCILRKTSGGTIIPSTPLAQPLVVYMGRKKLHPIGGSLHF